MWKFLPTLLAGSLILQGIGHAQCLSTETFSSDPRTSSRFGRDFAILGDRLFVGAYGETPDREPEGAVLLFERTGANWFVKDRLVPKGVETSVRTGMNIGAGPAGVVTSSPHHFGPATGLYVFEEVGTEWISTRLKATGAATSYPAGLAVGGDFVAVGFPRDDEFGIDTGSVHLFGKPDGLWATTAKLAPLPRDSHLHFGEELAYTDGVLAVSATGDDENGDAAGAVYLFEHTAGPAWQELQKITPRDGSANDFFGSSIGFDGTTLAIGATGEDVGTWNSGAVYVFEMRLGQWTEVQKIVCDPAPPELQFGRSIAVLGNRMIVGSFARDPSVVFVYQKQNGVWAQTDQISSQVDRPQHGLDRWSQELGECLALAGDQALVASSLESHGIRRLGTTLEFSLDEMNCGGLVRNTMLSTGSTVLTIDRGGASAGRRYFLLGTYTGTSPGIGVGAERLPLNLDSYFEVTLMAPTYGLLRGSYGFLDANGRAQITMDVPPEYVAALGNMQLHHAFLELDGSSVTHVSNPVGTWMWPKQKR